MTGATTLPGKTRRGIREEATVKSGGLTFVAYTLTPTSEWDDPGENFRSFFA
jgi:hypothetical protein